MTALSVVLHLGAIEKSRTEPTRVIGQQLHMDGLSGVVYITPAIAQQWLPILTEIANEGTNK